MAKNTVVYGIYKNRSEAEAGVDALLAADFRNEDISVLLQDNVGTKDFAHEKHTKAPEGTATGATTGGVLGGTLGLLAGIGALAIPGVGPFIAAGPIMGTLAGIANGLASNLIQRAADVSLKERRPLILCVRETPFNKIHLRNMTLAADAGAVIFPVIPAFYNRPMDAAEMAEQFVCRVLAHIGLPQPDAYIWKIN